MLIATHASELSVLQIKLKPRSKFIWHKILLTCYHILKTKYLVTVIRVESFNYATVCVHFYLPVQTAPLLGSHSFLGLFFNVPPYWWYARRQRPPFLILLPLAHSCTINPPPPPPLFFSRTSPYIYLCTTLRSCRSSLQEFLYRLQCHFHAHATRSLTQFTSRWAFQSRPSSASTSSHDRIHLLVSN